ncbi:MAG: outer membrane beta-barrel protein [Ignavibacteria bacterium]|nr:outer membrane beta-barrel protein [Ignavibacteria bacterium]
MHILKKYLYIFIFTLFGFAQLSANDLSSLRLKGVGDEIKSNNSLHKRNLQKLFKTKSSLFNLDLNIQLGIGIANTDYELNKVDSNTNVLNNTSSKIGPSIGAVLSLDFLGYGFTSGFQYTNKGFETNSGKTNLNYLNIPLLLYFGFDVGKIQIDGNLGPYFGLLLSQDKNDVIPVKNFDLGLTGNLQGAYMFNNYIGALLGVKYEYGGLNNLGKNEKVNKINTSTFNIYSGIKFQL